MDGSSMSTPWSLGSRNNIVGVDGKNVRGWGGELGNAVFPLKNCMRLSQSKSCKRWRSDSWNPIPRNGSRWRKNYLLLGCVGFWWWYMLQWMASPLCIWTALIGPSGLLRKGRVRWRDGQLLRALASLPKDLSLTPSSPRISGFPTQIHIN